MNTKHYIGRGICLLLLAAGCSGADDEPMRPATQPEATAHPISCSVKQSNLQSTRALIAGDTDLQTACTSTASNGGGEAIAIYGTYKHESMNSDADVFSLSAGFTDGYAELVYAASVGSNPSSDWNYEHEQYWVRDAAYNFLAYYPADFGGEGSGSGNSITTASSTIFTATCNTLTQQKDLMVAQTQIDAATEEVMANTVPLEMLHTLAAVGFQVKMADGSTTTTTLTSLSLYNLYTEGTVSNATTAFDVTSKTENSTTYTTANALTNNHWTTSGELSTATSGAYQWNSSQTVTNTATAVKGFNSDNLGTYAEDGYILVVPQTNCTPKIDLVTTYKSYSAVQLASSGVTFEPGKKYTYIIEVKDDCLKVTLRIKEWNNLNSSYDISF